MSCFQLHQTFHYFLRWGFCFLSCSLLMRKSLFKHLTDRGIQVRLCFYTFYTIFSLVFAGNWYPFCARVWFQVYIWVLNDEEDFQRAFDLGATGVMTDFPTRLKDFMDRNGISKPQWHKKMSWPPLRPACNVFLRRFSLRLLSLATTSTKTSAALAETRLVLNESLHILYIVCKTTFISSVELASCVEC